MIASLCQIDHPSQRVVDQPTSGGLLFGMGNDEDEKRDLGSRLAGARKLAGLTQDAVARALSDQGCVNVKGKGTVSAWEKGRNLPDALVLRRLAKLYNVTPDALLWDNAVSIDAMQIAVQFDQLQERQRRTFKTMWLAFFADAAAAGEDLPLAPAVAPSPSSREQSH